MQSFLTGLWSTLMVRGVLSVIFGLCAFVWPGNFMAAPSVWSALGNKQQSRMFPVIAGLLAIAIGLAAVLAPATFIGMLILMVGLWNVYLGVLQIITAIAMRKELGGSGTQAVWGIVSILFGLAIAYYWWAGVVTIAWLIGLASITTGAILIWLGFRLRHIANRLPKAQA